MPLPYRTILHLPASTDLVALAEQEVQSWLESRKKVDPRKRSGFLTGKFFEPGFHDLGRGRSLAVARIVPTKGATTQVLLRFIEASASGTWQVDMLALDSVGGAKRSDTLLIDAQRVDDPDTEGQVDPPGLVSNLLAREDVRDSKTPVTSEPRLMRAAFADEVFEAITDQNRSVSVIAASTINKELENRTRDAVRQLTSKVTGVASVFVLTADATDALNRRLPSSHRLEPGRVRTYFPGVELDDPSDGRRHRILGPQTFAHAIQGRRVAAYLQQSFAFQIRSSLLTKPLPRTLRRQWALLDEQISRLTREADVERRVRESQAETRRERSRQSVNVPILDRLVKMLSKWFDREVLTVGAQELNNLDTLVERLRLESESGTLALQAAEAQVRKARDAHDEFLDEFEFRGLELADAERTAAKLTDENKYLQRKLVETGKAAEAYQFSMEDLWEPPADIGELALRLMVDSKDNPIIERVVFTGDLDRAVELDLRDQNGLYVQRCWEFIRVLHDYAGMKANGSFAGNVQAYLKDDDHDGYRVPLARHAPVETKSTMDRWGSERVFPVPEDVNGTRSVVMEAHFRAGQQNTLAPRLYYFDDTANTGKVYVGYIGRHLTNTKTKNA